LIELKAEIESKINSVENLKLRELLKCRYLDFKSWEEIAYLNGYSWRHVFRLHEKALDEIKI
jgi:DNA-directed RNA polymerase specialized sigma subunit